MQMGLEAQLKHGVILDVSQVLITDTCPQVGLVRCRSSLACANGVGCQTVAFPAISCGIYGYPEDEGAEVRSYLIF